MAGNTTLDSSPGIAFRAHHYVKNIETANLGYYYSKSLESLNYFIVDCVAKPAINRAPEWTYNNRVIDSIKTHRTLSLAIAGTIAVALFIYAVYLMHPKKAGTTPKTPETDPKTGGTPDTAAPGPSGAKAGQQADEAKGKKPEGAEDAAKANGAASKTGNPTDTPKSEAPLDDESSSSKHAGDAPKGKEKEKRRASDPGKPLGSSSATSPLTATSSHSSAAPGTGQGAPTSVDKQSGSPSSVGKKDEFDLDAMTVEKLDGTSSLPPPGEKKIVDTLDKKDASGAPVASGDAALTEDDLEAAMEKLLAKQNAGSLPPTAPKSPATPLVAGAEKKEKKE